VRAWLNTKKVLICAGSGGVGKTSISATLGVMASQAGLRTLVMTIDPAQRLAQSLGIDNRPGEEVVISPQLTALMLDARKEFDGFVLGAVDKGVAKALFNNRLYQQLTGNLSGSQEFTSLVRLLKASQSKRFDLIILDTPPTQNAVDFLRAPERLYALFQESVMSWFANAETESAWWLKALHRGTRMVTGALEKVTGSAFIHDLRDFFTHLSRLQGRIAKVSQDVSALLHDPATGFVLVTGFDESKLKEAAEFQADLKVEDLRLELVVVNRWFAEWSEGVQSWPTNWQTHPQFEKLRLYYDQFVGYFSQRHAALEHFRRHIQQGRDVPVVVLPDFNHALQGWEDLTRMGDEMTKRWGDER